MGRKRSQYDLMHPLFDAMRSHKLKPNQRLVMLGLFRFMNGDGSCFPSYGALIEETGLTRPTIAKTLKDLKNLDLISFKSGDSTKSNRYQLNLEKIGLSTNKNYNEGIKNKEVKEKLKQVNGRFMNKAQCEMLGKNWEDYPD
jgi:DNA-binding MarR family transcriptional regulator